MEQSTEQELLLLTGFSSLALLAYKSFPLKNVFFDFCFWILPQYLIIVYPEYKQEYIGFFASCIDLKSVGPHLKQSLDVYDIPTWFRSNISLMVTISILAADLNFFPIRFGKSTHYGYKFMDIGVGSFVYNAGVMSVKFKWTKWLKSTLILLFLGFIRLMTVNYFDLYVNITEYGKHMNFYFMLAICNTLYALFQSRYDFLLGYILIVAYNHFLKQFKLATFILSDIPRIGFIEDNKEGIFNIISYLSIFLMSNLCGRIYFSKYSWKVRLLNLSVFTVLFFTSYKTHLKHDLPSRRIGNATYVFWILFLHTYHILIYYTLSIFTGSFVTITQLFTSRYMMFNFLMANFLILACKKTIDLHKLGHLTGNLLMMAYLLIIFVLPVLLSKFFFKLIRPGRIEPTLVINRYSK